MRETMAFVKLEICNLFGINVYRYDKDPSNKKRRTLLMVTIALVIVMLIGYIGGSAYFMTQIGIPEKIPMVYSLMACLMILAFGAFKAKAYLYREKDLMLLASLPVKSESVVAARLIRFYVENTAMGAIILVPAFLICGIYGEMDGMFFISFFMTVFLLPILPTVLAAWFGILVTAVVARNRHKALTETLVMLVIMAVALFFPMFLGMTGQNNAPFAVNLAAKDIQMEDQIRALSGPVKEAFEKLESDLPLMKTWGSIFLGENMLGLLIFGAANILLLIVTAVVIGRNFYQISEKLYPVTEHRDFHMSDQRESTLMMSLLQKEAKRYFSSGVYVANTIAGPVLAVAFTIALGFFTPEEIMSQVKGLPVDMNFQAALPFVIGMIFAMMNPAASSLSMEGKNWWILQSLPVSIGDVLQAKWVFSVLLQAPFYVMAQVIMLFTVQASLVERFWLLIVPAVLVLFSVTFSLMANVKFPKFQWETEVEVVKQSASVGISMLGCFAGLIPGLALFVIPQQYCAFATLAFLLVIVLVGCVLYRRLFAR